MMTEGSESISDFLNKIGMLKYRDMFIAKGFDLHTDVAHLTLTDLEKELFIMSAQDIAVILKYAAQYRPNPEQSVYEWLRRNYLERYHVDFMRNGLTDMSKIANLVLPDENVYDELEIMLPGHRKRLQRAVQKLKLEEKKPMISEAPVTFGRWAKPACLVQAKFDFLCVKAYVSAHQNPEHKICIDFMVDSGSDVSTIQEEYLNDLQLHLLGPIYSCGIHGGNHTNLYKARLKLGDQEMDIEVMGSNYNSLGSRVVRNFRHFIDGHHHIWLKGNYRDAEPIEEIPLVGGPLPLPGPSGTTGSAPDASISKLSLGKRKQAPGAEDTDSEPLGKLSKEIVADIVVSQSASTLNRDTGTSASHIADFSQNYKSTDPSEAMTKVWNSILPALPTKNNISSQQLQSSRLPPTVESISADHKPNANTNDDIDHMEPPAPVFYPPPLPSSTCEQEEPSMFIWVDNWSQHLQAPRKVDQEQNMETEEVVHVIRGQSLVHDGHLQNGEPGYNEELGIEVDSHAVRGLKRTNTYLKANSAVTFVSLEELEMLEDDELQQTHS